VTTEGPRFRYHDYSYYNNNIIIINVPISVTFYHSTAGALHKSGTRIRDAKTTQLSANSVIIDAKTRPACEM